MHSDFDLCYHAIAAKNPRYDGWFVTAVKTTGIYCRASCSARLPFARNVRFYPTAAAAQQAGFRACKQCRPDAAPGSPLGHTADSTAARAMRLIGDGIIEREGRHGLAARLGCTTDALDTALHAEWGAGAQALAHSQRLRTARILIESTELSWPQVAFAAGFDTVQQMHDGVLAVSALTAPVLRERARTRARAAGLPAGDTVALRLPARAPVTFDGLFGHLAASVVAGVEEIRDGAYRRTLRLPRGAGVVSLTPHSTHVHCVLRLDDMRDLSAAIARCRRLLDLDADPEAVDGVLGEDQGLSQLILAAPGQRIPRTVDEAELALRVVVGQQVSLKAARTHLHRLVARYGTPITDPDGGLTHLFPTPADLLGVTDGDLAFPASRQRTFRGLVRALAEGAIVLDPGSDWQQARRQLLALPGVGPWTAEMIAMRGLGDPDAFPATDLGVQLAAAQLGLPAGKQLSSHGERWRPWRAYATQYLWTSLPGEVNTWPPAPPVPAKDTDSDRRRRDRTVATANGVSR